MADPRTEAPRLFIHTERHTELLLLMERVEYLRGRTAALVARSQSDRERRERERKILRCLRALDCVPVHGRE